MCIRDSVQYRYGSFATEPTRAKIQQSPLCSESDQNVAAPRMKRSAIRVILRCRKAESLFRRLRRSTLWHSMSGACAVHHIKRRHEASLKKLASRNNSRETNDVGA